MNELEQVVSTTTPAVIQTRDDRVSRDDDNPQADCFQELQHHVEVAATRLLCPSDRPSGKSSHRGQLASAQGMHMAAVPYDASEGCGGLVGGVSLGGFGGVGVLMWRRCAWVCFRYHRIDVSTWVVVVR